MGRAWLLALGVGISAACIVDLDHHVACGDGFHDREVEECDPEDDESFADACDDADGPSAQPRCNPITCTLECSWCGDGIVDDGEECEPGDGSPGELASPRACAGAGIGTDHEVPPLASPYLETPYSSGQSVRCLADCTYDRTECGYCGDGQLQKSEAWLVSLPTQSPTLSYRPEWCDGEEIDRDELASFYDCGAGAVANVECSADCRDFTFRPMQPQCCVPQGKPCPADGDEARCCHELAHPEIEQHCTDDFATPGAMPTGTHGRTCL